MALIRDYGSTVAGWRFEFVGPGGKSRPVTFGHFCPLLQRLALSGNVKRLWHELVGPAPHDRKVITFRDIDPVAQQSLDDWRQCFLRKSSSLVKAWDEQLDNGGLGSLDEADFVAGCEANCETCPGPPKGLFKMLIARIGQRSLKLEDLRPLLIGVAATEAAAIWDGGGGGGGGHGSPVALEESSRARSDKLVEAHHVQDKVIKSLNAFKKMLVVKYGSLFSAWKRLLDVDHNGVVSQLDFTKACQFLGVRRIKAVWSEIDPSQRGLITLKDLDRETADAFEELEKLLIEQYGSTKEGWQKVFDPQNTIMCEVSHFVERCKELGYRGDAKRLFNLVSPLPGTKSIAYKDIWLDLNPNQYALSPKVSDAKCYKSPLRSGANVTVTIPVSPKNRSL